MSQLNVLNSQGKESSTIELPKDLFEGAVNAAVIHQAVTKYQASLRQGNASTKERGSVSGGGIKPWRQKGTGRARAGSTRSPLWTGGGVVFGPHPRDFGYDVSKKVKKVALRESLNSKLKDNNLLCVEDFQTPLKKTKEFAEILKNLKIKDKTLAILDGSDPTINRVSRNIRLFNIIRSADVNAYDILKHKKILVTKTAFNNLLERIK